MSKKSDASQSYSLQVKEKNTSVFVLVERHAILLRSVPTDHGLGLVVILANYVLFGVLG